MHSHKYTDVYSNHNHQKSVTKFSISITSPYIRRTYRGGGLQGVQTPALFRYNPNCALKFLHQFKRNALKNQFKKGKNPSKLCTNNILLKFFNATLRRIHMNLEWKSAGQKNAELIFEKLHLIRKLKFRIFNSIAVIFYLSFHVLSCFRVIHSL